ncbi:MAG: hypothetical protein GY759_08560 [Chloroflexi bacterium]|nr:hypothetical protein [Chloroflexota bacterium]
MILSDDMYVPAMRWRQAEYQALLRLRPQVKDKVVPLISIPEVEFDFELRQLKKSVHEHVFPFVGRFHAKWGTRPAWVTLNEKIAIGRMDDGRHVYDYIFDGLRPHQAHAIPAIPIAADTDTLNSVKRASKTDGHGVGIILRIEDLMGGPRGKISALIEMLSSSENEVDLIIDLRAPNFEPYASFATALIASMRRLGDIDGFRNFVMVSTAIPQSFVDIARGTDEIPRHDWMFYQTLLEALPSAMRLPNYGDYTIVHPDFVAMDMRMIKAAGKVIYTTPNTWGTRKGGAFRGNEEQMHAHCASILEDDKFQFQGAGFSFGDAYIAKCAVGDEKPSNLTRWKDVAINHHITMVTNGLSKFAAAS